MRKLEACQREQFHQALIKAFPTFEALEQVVSFKLDCSLQEITPPKQDYSATAFSLIKWAEAKGKIDELVEGAYQSSPTSPLLKGFYQEVWQPLLSSPELASPMGNEQLEQEPSNILPIGRQRHFAEMQASNSDGEAAPPLPFSRGTTSSQEKTDAHTEVLLSIHEKIKIAYEAIQVVIHLIQPEKEIYDYQCQLSIQKISEADSTIKQIPEKLTQLPFVHIPARYFLDNELASFADEVERVAAFLQQFSIQTSLLPLRKKIWDKLQKIRKSLQDLENLISILAQHIDKK